MDPEEPSLSTFIDCTKIEPYISYDEICGIKTFNTINMIDDNESIVFSEVNLDENYKLLTGSINVITLKKDEGRIGLGLKNVYRRLLAYYGTELRFSVESEEDCGTIVTINIPVEDIL